MQIRRAQRTYRHKKEATITTLKTRVESLERTLQNVSDILGPVGDSVVDIDHARRTVLAEINQTRSPLGAEQQSTSDTAETLPGIFGYNISRDVHGDPDLHESPIKSTPFPTQPHPRSPSPLLNRLFPSSTIYTYSYQESDLSRRLQRFCLEHTYRWLSDPHSDPSLLSRVLGLVPCINDMPGVRRALRRVIRSEIGSPLEGTKLPFYTLGGAGKHFPRTHAHGHPIYPENTRRPGKILRRFARILQRGGIQDWDEDWSGNAEPESRDWQEEKVRGMGDEDRLRALELDGEWFDCHDVQGYLEQRGVVLKGSSLWLEVPAATVGTLHGASPGRSASQFYVSSTTVSPSETSASPLLDQSGYVLNVENFFESEYCLCPNAISRMLTGQVLLANLRMLGRAPGFRLFDLEAALRSAIQRRPFS